MTLADIKAAILTAKGAGAVYLAAIEAAVATHAKWAAADKLYSDACSEAHQHDHSKFLVEPARKYQTATRRAYTDALAVVKVAYHAYANAATEATWKGSDKSE